MLDSNLILGINTNLQCEAYSHGVLTQNFNNLPCGAPIVYSSDLDFTDPFRTSLIATLITPAAHASIESTTVQNQIIAPIDIKPLYENHEVLTVSDFNIGKFDRLLDFIRDVGGISLVIENEHGRHKAMRGVSDIQRRFKYGTVFYYNGWSKKYLSGEDDKYVCILSFFDLPYCVPLFNMHKVDGIGLSITGATIKASKEYGQLHRTFKCDIIYTNYEENVYVIDGVSVNEKRAIEAGTYAGIQEFLTLTLPIQNAPLKKKASSKYKTTFKMPSVKAGVAHGEVEFPSDPPSAEWQHQTFHTTADGITTGTIITTNSDGSGHSYPPAQQQPEEAPTLQNISISDSDLDNIQENNMAFGEEDLVEPANIESIVFGQNTWTTIPTTPEEVPDEAPDDHGPEDENNE